MPEIDLPQPVLFIIFLSLFVLFGIFPAVKKTADLIRDSLRKAGQKEGGPLSQSTNQLVSYHADQHLNSQLDDFEIFILRRLAQQGNKALSRRKINADLHLEKPMLKAALQSLLNRGLINISVGNLTGIRFYLSRAGHDYAMEQGFITSVHYQN